VGEERNSKAKGKKISSEHLLLKGSGSHTIQQQVGGKRGHTGVPKKKRGSNGFYRVGGKAIRLFGGYG